MWAPRLVACGIKNLFRVIRHNRLNGVQSHIKIMLHSNWMYEQSDEFGNSMP